MKTYTHPMKLVGAVLLVSVATMHAADWDRLYLNADAGATFQQNAHLAQVGYPTLNTSFKPGARGDLAVGYNLNKSCAVELESGFMWNSVAAFDGRSVASLTQAVDIYSVPIMANFIYKFVNTSGWTPYVGVGAGVNVGILQLNYPGFTFSDTDLTFAYQCEAGLRYSLTKNASFGLAYKFYGTTDQVYYLRIFDFTDHSTFSNVYIHGVFASFTWNF